MIISVHSILSLPLWGHDEVFIWPENHTQRNILYNSRRVESKRVCFSHLPDFFQPFFPPHIIFHLLSLICIQNHQVFSEFLLLQPTVLKQPKLQLTGLRRVVVSVSWPLRRRGLVPKDPESWNTLQAPSGRTLSVPKYPEYLNVLQRAIRRPSADRAIRRLIAQYPYEGLIWYTWYTVATYILLGWNRAVRMYLRGVIYLNGIR